MVGNVGSGYKRWGAFVVLLGVTGAGIWYTTSQQESKRKVSKAVVAPLTCTFTTHTTRSFSLLLEANSKVDIGQMLPSARGGASSVQPQRVGLQGKLHLRVVESAGDGATLAFWLELSKEALSTAQAKAEMLAELARPVLVKVDPLCEFSEFGFESDVGPGARNQLRGILQSAQMVLAKEPKNAAWQHLEYDMAGRFGARYTREAGRERGVRKTKFGYLEVFPPDATQSSEPTARSEKLSVQVRGSDTLAIWAEDGQWFDEFASVERLLFMTGNRLLADVSTKLVLKRLPETSTKDAPDLTSLAWVKGTEPPAARPEDALEAPPSQFKTMRIEQALAQAEALIRGASPDHPKAGYLLAYLMRAQPELIPELVGRVRSGSMLEDLHSAFFFGLEQTGTPEARAALVGALDDSTLQPANRMRAAAALPDIAHPDADTLAALNKLVNEGSRLKDVSDAQRLENAATFAIGTLERRQREKNPALATQARESIREHLREAKKDPIKITAALDAIHNSGHPSFIPDLQPHFASDKTMVRKHAYEALKRMPVESTAPLFESLLGKESDPQQRAVLAVSFADQAREARVAPPQSVWNPAASKLSDERNALVRASYVHLIGMAAESSEGAVTALAEQYHKESDPRMLQAIGRYVPGDKLRK